MPLTPADVHNVAFKKPPIGKRGYDEEEVDAFLDEVERELARLIEENNQLRGHLGGGPVDDNDRDQRLRAEVAALKAQVERVRREKAGAEQAATSIQADLDQARSQTSGESETQGARVLMMAQRTADDHISDARREADKLLGEARAKAQEIFREAQGNADALEREARERHQQTVGSIDKKRNELLENINGLYGLAQDYRNRLKEALMNQLQDMETVPTDMRAGGRTRSAGTGSS